MYYEIDYYDSKGKHIQEVYTKGFFRLLIHLIFIKPKEYVKIVIIKN